MGETRQTWRRGRGKGKVCGCLGIRREKEKKVAAKRLNRYGKRDHKRERSLVRISTPIKRNSKGMKGWFCQYDCSVSVTLSALSRNIYSNDFPVMGPLNSSHTHTHTHTLLMSTPGLIHNTETTVSYLKRSDQTESALIKICALRIIILTFISMLSYALYYYFFYISGW